MSESVVQMKPNFEIRDTDEFHVFRNFFLTTGVIPVKVDRVKDNGKSLIAFYISDESDRVKALGSLSKLYKVFYAYKYVRIRFYNDLWMYNKFFEITGIHMVQFDTFHSNSDKKIVFYVMDKEDQSDAYSRINYLYNYFKSFDRIYIKLMNGCDDSG